MDKLNKWYQDSSWRKKKWANEQATMIKSVDKEFGDDALKSTIKIELEAGWYNVYVKRNINKKTKKTIR